MRKTILMLLLALASGNATAKWVRVGSTDNLVSYADPDTIRKSGAMVRMWDMFDCKSVELCSGKPYLSSKERYEYDCKEERGRMLLFSNHAGKMGRGKIVESDAKPDVWMPIPRGSVRETMRKFACGKK